MSRLEDAIYAAANAEDPRVGAKSTWTGHQVSTKARIDATRATILRFLQAVEDESITVLEMREELEE